MPSRKQRRRREKLQRHEYEYVIETEEGEEIPVESPRDPSPARNGKGTKAVEGPVDRRGRPVEKPTFRRVLRRAAIFAPLIAVFLYWTNRDLNVVQLAFNVLVLLAFFIPFSYMVDLFVYRTLLRRYERDRAARRSR